MNPVLASELANLHISGLRDEAARRASQAGVARSRRAGRRQVGFVLIEAGLRLVTR
jgi:hypothetical protein